MSLRNVIWPVNVREKLLQFRSPRFTREETLDYIFQFILEVEEILKSDVFERAYTEEHRKYRGLSRIVVRKFRIYFKKGQAQNDMIILAVLFPGEK
jgi:hypothetical protein